MLLLANVNSVVETNFIRYFAPNVRKVWLIMDTKPNSKNLLLWYDKPTLKLIFLFKLFNFHVFCHDLIEDRKRNWEIAMVEGSRLSATVQSMSSEKLLLFESQLSEAVAIEQAKVCS